MHSTEHKWASLSSMQLVAKLSMTFSAVMQLLTCLGSLAATVTFDYKKLCYIATKQENCMKKEYHLNKLS